MRCQAFILAIISVLIPACSHFELSGNLAGNDRGARNQVEIVNNWAPNLKLRSKISQPYSFNDKIFSIPDYSEHSMEFYFW